MAERSLSIEHVTVWRWVQHYAPVLNQRIRREIRPPSRSWRVDKKYVKVAGSWACGYRTLHSAGETIDFMLSPKRDLIVAKLFLRLAFSGGGPEPRDKERRRPYCYDSRRRHARPPDAGEKGTGCAVA